MKNYHGAVLPHRQVFLKVTTLLIACCLNACSPVEPDSIEPEELDWTKMSDVIVPDDFDFSSRAQQTLHVEVKHSDKSAYFGVKIDVVDTEGQLIAVAQTNHMGQAQLDFVVPGDLQEVVVRAPAIGIVQSEYRIFVASTPQFLNIR